MPYRHVLGLIMAAWLTPMPLLAAEQDAAALADQYLRWFQNNVRGINPTRADTHWSFYVQYAGEAGLPLWDRAEVEAYAETTALKLHADGTTPSTPTSDPDPTPGVPSDWDEAWRDPLDLDGNADNGESTPYVKDLIAKMGSDLLGSGFEPGQGYLSRTYPGHEKPVQIPGLGLAYVNHTGTDWRKPIGASVRALTPGVVVGTYNARTSNQANVVIKQDGADRWWIYVHMSYVVTPGQHVAKGTKLGTIADPKGEWNHSHVHVNILTTWPRGPELSKYLTYGRSYHPDAVKSMRIAKAHTMHPLKAYARANGLLP